MAKIEKMPFDPSQPLTSKVKEKFAVEYVKLDIEEGYRNTKARRIEAFRRSGKEDRLDLNKSQINYRAGQWLKEEEVAERVDYLYSLEHQDIEIKYAWTEHKSIDTLINMLENEDNKAADRIKIIEILNKMKGLDKQKLEEGQESDEVNSFFSKVFGIGG